MWEILFLVAFLGLIFMFYCILRRQDAILKEMKDNNAKNFLLIRSIETHLKMHGTSEENLSLSFTKETPLKMQNIEPRTKLDDKFDKEKFEEELFGMKDNFNSQSNSNAKDDTDKNNLSKLEL